MILENTGNVGIGTDSPLTKVHIGSLGYFKNGQCNTRNK